MVTALDEFASAIAEQVIATLTSDAVDEQTVVAVAGLATLFGLTRASAFAHGHASIRGRMPGLFPASTRDRTTGCSTPAMGGIIWLFLLLLHNEIEVQIMLRLFIEELRYDNKS